MVCVIKYHKLNFVKLFCDIVSKLLTVIVNIEQTVMHQTV